MPIILLFITAKVEKHEAFFPEEKVESFWKVFHQTISTTTSLTIKKKKKKSKVGKSDN